MIRTTRKHAVIRQTKNSLRLIGWATVASILGFVTVIYGLGLIAQLLGGL